MLADLSAVVLVSVCYPWRDRPAPLDAWPYSKYLVIEAMIVLFCEFVNVVHILKVVKIRVSSTYSRSSMLLAC